MKKNPPNFWNIWNIKTYFGKMFSVEYVKVYIIGKIILSDFHCFLFHESILYTSEVITLLVTAYIIHQQGFGHFLPPFSEVSRVFLGKTSTYIKSTKAAPWLLLSRKIFKFCASRSSKNALSGLAYFYISL